MSVSDIERGLVARYLARVLARSDLTVRSLRQILFWQWEQSAELALPVPARLTKALGNYQQGYNPAEVEQAFRSTRTEILHALEVAARETPPPEPLAANVKLLIDTFGLTPADAAWKLVGLAASCQRYEKVLYLSNRVLDHAPPLARAVAVLIGEQVPVIEELLAPSGELVASGLLQVREAQYLGGAGGRLEIPFRLNACLDRAFTRFDTLREALLGPPLLASSVTLDDYQHVAADRDLIVAVLKGGAAAGAAGINVLLYGPPGSGKTELAKVAAAAAGLTLFAAGEEAPHGGEFDRSGRLADLVFSQRLLAGKSASAFLFDEMEDVAVHLIRRGGSKVYMNRVLETNPVPILWTSNELGNIDPALLRRMTLAIELRRPPAPQRKRIIEQLIARNELQISEPEIARLAQQLDATPAIIANAMRAAKFAGGGADTVEHAARGIMRAVSGLAAKRIVTIPSFDPALTRASQDLTALADQLVGGRARAFSLCLFGPPGTGKSAFARYLAGRLGLEILQKRASDILGPFVGQSERNIALAFEEARDSGALLVFDEADSLLFDRRDAVRSWEITQVNEMLTWMEEHPLPVCFTTNLMDRIDQASLRRFTFNVRFDHLDRAGLERAWLVFFGLDMAPAGGLQFANLAPGDFAKARKQAEVLGILGNPEQLAGLVAEISRSKPGAQGTLGFVS